MSGFYINTLVDATAKTVIHLPTAIPAKSNMKILHMVTDALRKNGFFSYIVDFMENYNSEYYNCLVNDDKKIASSNNPKDKNLGHCLHWSLNAIFFKNETHMSLRHETNVIYIDLGLYISSWEDEDFMRFRMETAFKEIAHILDIDEPIELEIVRKNKVNISI
jgi:hypothetical protein